MPEKKNYQHDKFTNLNRERMDDFAPFTEAQREELQYQVYELSAAGKTHYEIAKILQISKTTVTRYMRAEKEERRKNRSWSEVEEACATYRKVIKDAFDKIEAIPNEALSTMKSSLVSQFFTNIIQARKNIDQIKGLEAPKEWFGHISSENVNLDRLSPEKQEMFLEALELVLGPDDDPALEATRERMGLGD